MNDLTLYLHHAMSLAEFARGRTSPNPFVGAVIVKDNKIVGEGFTQPYGLNHAEVQAILQAGELCQGADLYVTLEPCAHYGKTPPCVEAIIKAGIKRVYAGIIDPNPLVNGKGFEKMSQSGIEVHHGFLQKEISRQLEYYLTYMTLHRPFVILKTAMSLDGRIAAEDGSATWITCEQSRSKVHQLRQECDVILSGIGTVLADNPRFNVRLPETFKQPVRAILDSHLRIPLSSNLVHSAHQQKTIIYTLEANNEKSALLRSQGVEVIQLDPHEGRLNLSSLLSDLYKRKYYSVLLEAGSELNSAFLRQRLVDKLYVFIALKLLGGNKLVWKDIGIPNLAQAIKLDIIKSENIGKDILLIAYPIY